MDVDIGKRPEHACHCSRMCVPPVDRLLVSGNLGDHVRVMRGVHRSNVLTVKRVVAHLHKRQNVGQAVRGLGWGSRRAVRQYADDSS